MAAPRRGDTVTLGPPGPEPTGLGRFGEFGGRYVPETLVPALEELEAEFRTAWASDEFRAEYAELLTSYAGRPTPVTECHRLSERLGVRVLLKREDLTHTGSHKINNVLGQALLARRMGKQRVIAETGAGQHGVATATAAALFGLDCVVFMGAVDVDRQALNVFRMKLLGAEVIPVTSGSATLKDAINDALRDWVATVRETHYCIGSVVGPHPFPWMVREFQRIVGDEAREQCREILGGADPDLVVACVGGGSNAMGTFAGFVDTDAELIGVEAGGLGIETGHHGASVSRGTPGALHGARSLYLQDEDGQILEAHSISAGLDYPGRRARSTRRSPPRSRRVPVGDRRGGPRGVPAPRRHRRHRARRSSPPTRSDGWPARSGRRVPRGRHGAGDAVGPGRQGRESGRRDAHGRGAAVNLETTLRARRDAGHKLLVPYVTGGLGRGWLDVVRAVAAAGADAIEVGIPFSDPVMDGRTIQEASQRALEIGATPASIVDELAGLDAGVPIAVMTYYNPVHHMGHERFAQSLAASGVDAAIVPDLPLDELDGWADAADGAAVETVLLAAPTTSDERLRAICARSRGFVYGVALLGITGERSELAAEATEMGRRLKAVTDVPVLLGLGISNTDQAREAAGAADGVIVGSALGAPTARRRRARAGRGLRGGAAGRTRCPVTPTSEVRR